jgi:hypothetical protein
VRQLFTLKERGFHMDLIDYSNELGDEVKKNREIKKLAEQQVEQAKEEAHKEEKQHEENKRQGML